jgi:hypothetical protein
VLSGGAPLQDLEVLVEPATRNVYTGAGTEPTSAEPGRAAAPSCAEEHTEVVAPDTVVQRRPGYRRGDAATAEGAGPTRERRS